jgi:hypothetical protein
MTLSAASVVALARARNLRAGRSCSKGMPLAYQRLAPWLATGTGTGSFRSTPVHSQIFQAWEGARARRPRSTRG